MSTQTIVSPLHDQHEQNEALFLPYGDDTMACAVVESFGSIELEYAAIRKGCVVFDENHMGTLEIRGDDRIEFLNNMLSAKIDDLSSGQSRWSFWLNRKGRIDADLFLSETPEALFVRVDRHLARKSSDSLDAFLFAEDVQISDVSEQFHRFSLHGPTAQQLLNKALECEVDLKQGQNTTIRVGQYEIIVERDDLCGEIGLGLIIPASAAAEVYTQLQQCCTTAPELRARAGGWLAINAARIEAGRVLFNLDFGQSNLPVESGIIDARVHFAKGCYLGQEVVARMHARGAFARRVVAFRVDQERASESLEDMLQPTTGSQIFADQSDDESAIGMVTSSTISPMLGAVPIGFAMVKSGFVEPGTRLRIAAEGGTVEGIVQDGLVFWSRAGIER